MQVKAQTKAMHHPNNNEDAPGTLFPLFNTANPCRSSSIFTKTVDGYFYYPANPSLPTSVSNPLTLSIASGSIIQAKHIGKDIMAGLRIIVGGELTKYPKMLEEARAKAINRMVQDAKNM